MCPPQEAEMAALRSREALIRRGPSEHLDLGLPACRASRNKVSFTNYPIFSILLHKKVRKWIKETKEILSFVLVSH